MFKLVIQDDEGKTTVVPLIRDEITIGRKEGNTIRLTERNVSRRHARISRNNGEVHIEDLGSYNGIRVNNARIAERVSLRVSDQVQIGDYKLYLKAEGLEQTDPQATDRPDSQTATESMASVNPAITAPQAVVQPAPSPTGPHLVGSPNRTMVAIGDTDPAGRPVATPAAVAALTAAAAYGRLVVVSSNFVGKEFELTRPQMIIGRTDENDIVVNHRSISRNHAKVTREPETGRYTISDLQSSNGVRVNGQDYGKVELRRGDVVDLGHVRLRFVEAGEDFVFDRDAVITDVPESGGKRGAVFVILAAIVLIGAGVAIYTTMIHGDKPKDDVAVPVGQGTNSGIAIDAGEAAVAIEDHGSDRAAVPAHPGTEPAGSGSEVAAPAGAAVKPVDEKSQKLAECTAKKDGQNWQELADCSAALDKLGLKDKARELGELAKREQRNAITGDSFHQALREHNLKEAQAQLAKIGAESVYYGALHDQFSKGETQAIDAAVHRAQTAASSRDCAAVKIQIRQLQASSTPRVAAAVQQQVKCAEKVEPSGTPKPPPGTGSGSSSPSAASTPAPVAKQGCEPTQVDEQMAQALIQYNNGFAPAALKLMASALNCRQNVMMYRLAAQYACGGRDLTAARLYYAKLPPQFQAAVVQRCQQEGLDPRPQ